jgi:hypothetical protein
MRVYFYLSGWVVVRLDKAPDGKVSSAIRKVPTTSIIENDIVTYRFDDVILLLTGKTWDEHRTRNISGSGKSRVLKCSSFAI